MLNIGRMKMATVQLYRLFMDRVAASAKEDHARFLNLENFLEMGSTGAPVKKEGADEGEDTYERELGERQQERSRGGHGIKDSVAEQFRNIIYDYLPGGYAEGSKEVRELTDNFFAMAKKGFGELIPKLISQKLRASGVEIPKKLEINDDMLYNVIVDAMAYFQEHPDEVKSGIVRAYAKKFEGEGEDKELAVGQAYFRPKVDEAYYTELLKNRESEESEPELEVGDIDTGVLANLEASMDAGRPVTWKWVGIEGGMLRFTLPELYGDRKFIIRLPFDVRYMRPGTYTWRIKQVNKSGAVVEFVEQRAEIFSDYASQVEDVGLGVDQLRTFINNGIINRYISVLRQKSALELVEDFTGQVAVTREGGDKEDDYDFAGEKKTLKARGLKQIKEKGQSVQDRLDELSAQLAITWSGAPAVLERLQSLSASEGRHLAGAVAQSFPPRAEKGKISLPAILATRPVVHMLMDTVFSPTTATGGAGGKAIPWVTLVMDRIRREAVRDPVLLAQFTELAQSKAGRAKAKKAPGTVGVISPTDAPAGVPVPGVTPPTVSDKVAADTQAPSISMTPEAVQAFISSIPATTFRDALYAIRDRIRDIILKSTDPTIQRVRDYRRYTQSYLKKNIEEFTHALVDISERPLDVEGSQYRKNKAREWGISKPLELPLIDPDSPEGQKIIEKQVAAFIPRLIKRMEGPGLSMTASTMDSELLQRVIVRAYHLVTSSTQSVSA